MQQISFVLVRGLMASTAMLAAMPALAQQPAAAAIATDDAAAPADDGTIVVTGSRIRRDPLDEPRESVR